MRTSDFALQRSVSVVREGVVFFFSFQVLQMPEEVMRLQRGAKREFKGERLKVYLALVATP